MKRKYEDISPLFGSYFLRKSKIYLGKVIQSHLTISVHTFKHVRLEINALWVRLNNKINPAYLIKERKIKKGTDLSINIACGGSGEKGWVNLDLMEHKNLSLRYDCRKNLPLSKKSVRRIRCEHFLEHLAHKEEAPIFLNNCFACLKEGGVLRVVVPDIGKFLHAYQSHSKEDWKGLGWDLDNLPEGFDTEVDILNHIFHQGHEHLYAYDFETLGLLLRKAGFNTVQRSEFGKSVDPELCHDDPTHKTYSLYAEAIK